MRHRIWRVQVPLVLLAVVLTCTPPIAGQAPYSSLVQTACTVTDLRADPQCMFNLTTRAKSGELQDVDALAGGILSCLGFNSSNIPVLRALLPEASTPTWSAADFFKSTYTLIFQSLAGASSEFVFAPAREAAYMALDTQRYPLNYFTIWSLGASSLTTLYIQGRIEPIDTYALSSPIVDFMGMHKVYRTSALYNGTLLGFPYGARLSFMYLRSDILQANNLPVPATWDDVLLTAQRLNGSDFNNDGQADYALCLQLTGNFCELEGSGIINLVLASMTQTQGPQTSWLFNPDTLESFVNTEAMTKTLTILRELIRYSWPSSVCYEVSPDLWAGRCAITITSDVTFKQIGMRRAPNPWRGRGRLVMAMTPGSHEVLDRTTGKLVECTSLQQCPYAKPVYSLARNATVLVNEAPSLATIALVGLNKYAPPMFKPSIGQMASILSGAGNQMTFFFNAPTFVPLTRYKQLWVDPASLRMWQSYGFNSSEVIAYLRLVNQTLDHPNVATDTKLNNGHLFKFALEDALYSVANNTPLAQVQNWLSKQFEVYLAQMPRRQFAESLWTGLNIPRTWQEPPPPALPPSTPQPTPATTRTSLSTGHILAIVLPSVAVLAAISLAAMWAVRRGWVRLGPLGPPSVGASTTLVVTDVEESTQLWETLPMHAMDTAIRLHHTLIRKLLAEHRGYESATEGDAFIMGFHTASQAMHFACDLQQQLMTQPWPEQVLSFHVSAPVWAKAQPPPQPQPTLMNPPALKPAGDSIKSDNAVIKKRPGSTHATTTLRIDPSDALPLVGMLSDTPTVQDWLGCQWRVVVPQEPFHADGTSDGPVLAYRGLRLRLGLHTGLQEEDVITNKTTGGLQYTGQALALAKAVADSGQGGMTCLSSAAFQAWHDERASQDSHHGADQTIDSLRILHLGTYAFTKAPDIGPSEVYWAVLQDMECRLALGRTKLRNAQQLASGVLQAPVGTVTVAHCTMVGYKTLHAWDMALAEGALRQYNDLTVKLLSTPGGCNVPNLDCSGQYLVYQSEGTCVAVFGSATSAIWWCLRVTEEMKEVEWPEALLEHELCESVTVTRDLLGGYSYRASLFHGPRVKAGVDTGPMACELSPTAARMAYTGPTQERAMRVTDKVPSGQVWCTGDTLTHVGLRESSDLLHLEAAGTHTLKGSAQPVPLHQCTLALEDQHCFSLVHTHTLSQADRSLLMNTASLGPNDVISRHFFRPSNPGRPIDSLAVTPSEMLHGVAADAAANVPGVRLPSGGSARVGRAGERSGLWSAGPSLLQVLLSEQVSLPVHEDTERA